MDDQFGTRKQHPTIIHAHTAHEKRRSGHCITYSRPTRLHPIEVTTDRAPAYPPVLDELLPSARHIVEQYVSNLVESDKQQTRFRCHRLSVGQGGWN